MESIVVKSWDTLLEFSQNQFNELNIKGKWLPKNKKGSTFHTSSKSDPDNESDNDNSVTNANVANTSSTNQNKKKAPYHIDRTPPKQGEAHTRPRKDGKGNEHWCPRCKDGGRWGNHLPDGHDKFVSEWQIKIKQRKENLANADVKSNDTVSSAPHTEINNETRTKLRPSTGHPSSANYAAHF